MTTSSTPRAGTPATGARAPRETFSSRSVFVFAAIGSAVGLGNIWRFPFVAYGNGGGAFLIPYLVALLTAGLPLLFLDYAIGHRFRGSAPLSFRRMRRWSEPIGWFQVFICIVIAVYYAVIIAWAACYAWFSVSEAWGSGYEESAAFFSDTFLKAGGGDFGLDFVPTIAWVLLATWVLTIGVLLAGVQKGIGRTAQFFVPILIVLFVAMVVRSLFLDGATDGLNQFFTPSWSALKDPTVWIAAYSQIFFSLSVAFGIMLTYTSYLKPRTNLTTSGLVVGFSNSAFEVLAGIGVFASLGFLVQSSQGAVGWSDVSGGPGLAFIAFPALISEMPGGPVFGVVFFLCLILAGLTSLISIVEVVVSSLRDKLDLNRTTATLAIGVPIAVVSMLLMPVRTGLQTLDILDKFINNLGIVGIALVMIICVGYVMRELPALRDHLNSVSTWKVGRFWIFCVAGLTVVVLAVTLFMELKSLVQEGYEGYSSSAIGVWGWGMMVVGIVFAIVLAVLPWPRSIQTDGVPTEHVGTATDITHTPTTHEEA